MANPVPQPRPLPPQLTTISPTQAVAGLMRRHASELAAERENTAAVAKQGGELAELVGLVCFRKRATPQAAEFRRLEEALVTHGVEMITHLGEPLTDKLAEMVDVIDWIPGADGIDPGCVAEAFEPEIRWHGRLVHRARVVCRLEDEPDTDPTAAPTPNPHPSEEDQDEDQ